MEMSILPLTSGRPKYTKSRPLEDQSSGMKPRIGSGTLSPEDLERGPMIPRQEKLDGVSRPLWSTIDLQSRLSDL